MTKSLEDVQFVPPLAQAVVKTTGLDDIPWMLEFKILKGACA